MRGYIIMIAIAAIGLAALAPYYDATQPAYWYLIVFSLVTGFLSGAMAPVLLYLYTGKTADEMIANRFSEVLNRVYAEYAPQKTYAPTSSLKNAFNRDLTQALCEASTYTFVGETGVHVPARIERRAKQGKLFASVEVVLAFSRRDKFLDQPYAIHGSNIKTTRRIAILASIFAMCDIAQDNPVHMISIFLMREGLGFRFEATDKVMFITESSNILVSDGYPASYKVERDSILGRIALNTLSVGKASASRIDAGAATTEDILAHIGYEVTADQIERANRLKEALRALDHG